MREGLSKGSRKHKKQDTLFIYDYYTILYYT